MFGWCLSVCVWYSCFVWAGGGEGTRQYAKYTVLWMGSSEQVPALSASWLRQGILWCEDRPVLRLAWFLHAHAYTGISCWSNLFCLQLLYTVWGSAKVINTMREPKTPSVTNLFYAVILTLFDATFFSFFCEAIIRRYWNTQRKQVLYSA